MTDFGNSPELSTALAANTTTSDPTECDAFQPRTGFGTPVGFSDASNDPDPADGLCQAGYCIIMCGGPVVFSSKKLKHKAPNGSTSHVEYMALCHCNQSVVWLRQLLSELGFQDLVDKPTVVYGDNAQANTLCQEDIVTSGNMYIYLPYHWNKEAVELGFVQIQDIRTALNVADLFTKPLPVQKIRILASQMLGYVPINYAECDRGFNKQT